MKILKVKQSATKTQYNRQWRAKVYELRDINPSPDDSKRISKQRQQMQSFITRSFWYRYNYE